MRISARNRHAFGICATELDIKRYHGWWRPAICELYIANLEECVTDRTSRTKNAERA
jgi:hypothetical protein